MKSILFTVLIAIAISSSFAVEIKGSCPKPKQPKVDNWMFVNDFVGYWQVLGRTEQTVPSISDNTLEISIFDNGCYVFEEGYYRHPEDNYWKQNANMTLGDFEGKKLYDTYIQGFQPYSFNFTTSDGNRGQFWMPYYVKDKNAQAVFASCINIDDSTVDVKAWFVAKEIGVSPSKKVKDLMKSLTGQEYIEVCHGEKC